MAFVNKTEAPVKPKERVGSLPRDIPPPTSGWVRGQGPARAGAKSKTKKEKDEKKEENLLRAARGQARQCRKVTKGIARK
jgi:hypothetical protein